MKKLTVQSVLFLSAGLVLLTWVVKVVRNVWFSEQVLETLQSMPRILMEALPSALITIVSVTLLLRMAGENFRDIGFHREHAGRQIGTGILAGVLIFVLDILLFKPLLDSILPAGSAPGADLSRLFENRAAVPVLLFIAIFKGGFCEELWRIFTLTRFEKIFGKTGLVASWILSSVVFGTGHLYQGLDGMISIALIGFLYASVYLRKRRAWEAVTAHATFNAINIVLGFFLYPGK